MKTGNNSGTICTFSKETASLDPGGSDDPIDYVESTWGSSQQEKWQIKYVFQTEFKQLLLSNFVVYHNLQGQSCLFVGIHTCKVTQGCVSGTKIRIKAASSEGRSSRGRKTVKLAGPVRQLYFFNDRELNTEVNFAFLGRFTNDFTLAIEIFCCWNLWTASLQPAETCIEINAISLMTIRTRLLPDKLSR